MFSKTCDYAIKATIFIAKKSLAKKRTNIKEIAKGIDSPLAFSAKILQQLTKNKIVQSTKGPNGGFEIEKERLKTIMLSRIVDIFDGNELYKGCGLGLHQCNEHYPCPLHEKFVIIRNDLRNMLESTNLYELAIGLDEGLTYLKR